MEPVAPYPFVALVGQDELKQALLLNAVNPRLGGVLIAGEKGTGKSTAVRSLAALLPWIVGVADCPYFCDPNGTLCNHCQKRVDSKEKLPFEKRRVSVVELPIGATDDRVVGALDLEKAIKEGERHFRPGLMARAHRGFLYIDEVNLLDDHLVDLLLDAAAMGVNTVERDGLSYSHPAEFILVGTMNPEEGDLRPQLLDRFGLSILVKGLEALEHRVELVRRRLAYDSDPESFIHSWAEQTAELSKAVMAARQRMPSVESSAGAITEAVNIALEAETDGHRAELVMIKSAQALAALNGLEMAEKEQVRSVANFCLAHRLRRLPFLEANPLSFSWEKKTNEPNPPESY